ncbi:MAG: zinc-binding dehydrogenase, partial [Inquilinus sp.]|nr:zinc-binding dehydrogenase [Inquilinus sp.]
ATVIGTAGSAEKVALARAHGCDHPIDYSREDFAARVKEITGGRGVDKVFDGIGKATFEGSFDSLAPMGHLVSFGQASGPVEPIAIAMLGQKSATLTRPSLFHYSAKREDLLAMAGNLMDVVAKGVVRIEVEQTYPLADAAQAHRDLEARKTTGSTVMLV